MDVQLLAVIVALLVIVITFILCFLRNSKERTYEEVYGGKNLTALLHGDKSTKGGKKNKGKKAKKEASESGSVSGDAPVVAQPKVEPVVKVVHVEEKTSEPVVQKAPVAKAAVAHPPTDADIAKAKALLKEDYKTMNSLSRQLTHAETRLEQVEAAKAKLEASVKQMREAADNEKRQAARKAQEERSKVSETESKLAVANSIVDAEKQKAMQATRELETVKQLMTAQAHKQNTDHQTYRQTMATNETERVKLAAENAKLKAQLASPPVVQQKVQPVLHAAPPPAVEDLSKPLAIAKKQVVTLEKELAGERQAASKVQQSFDKLSQLCERLRNERDENDNRLTIATKEMAASKKENVLTNGQMNGAPKPLPVVDTKKFTDKIDTLEASVSELTQKLATRNVEVAALKENVDRSGDSQKKVAQLQAELETLAKSSRAELCKSETGLKEELTKARNEAKEYKELAAKLERDVVTELRAEVASLSKQLADLSNIKDTRPAAVSVDTKVLDKLQAEVDQLKVKNAELRERNYAAVEAVIEAEKISQRVQATASKSKVTEKTVVVNGDDSKLRAEVAHYKQTLESLASTLTALEKEAAVEINKWQNRCEELERHTTLRDTVETTVVLKEIETVRDAVAERQYTEVREQLTVLQAKLRDDAVELDTTREQLRILTDTLETERSTGRDLSQQAVKLRGMLKVGQEALKHEQHTVTTLREQLRVLQA